MEARASCGQSFPGVDETQVFDFVPSFTPESVRFNDPSLDSPKS